jgi:hypothetical protein
LVDGSRCKTACLQLNPIANDNHTNDRLRECTFLIFDMLRQLC